MRRERGRRLASACSCRAVIGGEAVRAIKCEAAEVRGGWAGAASRISPTLENPDSAGDGTWPYKATLGLRHGSADRWAGLQVSVRGLVASRKLAHPDAEVAKLPELGNGASRCGERRTAPSGVEGCLSWLTAMTRGQRIASHVGLLPHAVYFGIRGLPDSSFWAW